MKVRFLNPEDVPILERMAERSGYPYPKTDAPNLEMVLVVADDEDNPIMAVALERIVQAYLWTQPMPAVEAKKAISMLHEYGIARLRECGYSELNGFSPPEIAQKFGRRLKRTWGWCENWPSFCLRF